MLPKKDELIQLIDSLVAPPAEAWRNDPFEHLLRQVPAEILQKYAPDDVEPSTSDEPRTVNADARVTFSKVLGGLYLDLAAYLDIHRSDNDEFTLLGLKDNEVVRKSFEFFLLTGILPFLEPGVGLGAAARSTYIKSWKLFDGNVKQCSERLSFAARVILTLSGSNDGCKLLFMKYYVDDLYAIRYQLNQFGVKEFESDWADLLDKFPSDKQFGALMFLLQDKKPQETPKWLKAAVGRQMSLILVSKVGLQRLLNYYKERAGETWTDHSPMTKQVGWQLATVPRICKHPRVYHENISNQFFDMVYSQKNHPDKNLLAVLCCYVEELRCRFSLDADTTVFDKILHFYEILNKRINEDPCPHAQKIAEFNTNHIRNLRILAEILPSADTRRIRELFNCFFSIVEDLPHVKDVLKASIESVGNFGFSLYNYVMTVTQCVQLVKKTSTSSLIQEIGAEPEEPEYELWLQGIGNVDEGIAKRMETAFHILDNLVGQQSQVRTIMEMMSFALDAFLKTSEKERDADAARFVDLNETKPFSSHHAHLVVGCCFERIITYADEAGFSVEECLQLIRLAESILNNSTQKFNRLAQRRRNVDVFSMTDDEKKELEMNRNTARLCLPIISTIFLMTQGSSRLHDTHLKALEAVGSFIKASDAFPTDDVVFNNTIEEMRNMLKSLKLEVPDPDMCTAPPIPPRTTQRKKQKILNFAMPQRDPANDYMEDLNDAEPAIKGGALMQIAKIFRTKNYLAAQLIEYGVFELVKELVADDDSYVYLAAINCLCEMGLYKSALFEELICYYKEIMTFDGKEEAIVIRVGRIGEAIGKIFLVKGDYSVKFFDRMTTIFITGMEDSHELVRASSCGALGNMVVATRGRGIEKWLDQLFHRLNGLLLVDRSVLVRRSAIDAIRQCLKACGKDMFSILRERLLEIHREVVRLKKTDRDETVRLHAELCCQEVNEALSQNHADTEKGYSRRIKF